MRLTLVHKLIYFFLIISLSSCMQDDMTQPMDPPEDSLYFPLLNADTWETTSPEELAYNQSTIDQLKVFLEESNTRAFLILKDGKIVVEEYFGEDFLNQPFTKNSNWYWASAGKSLIGCLAGIAQQEQLLDIMSSSADYLGHGWSSMTEAQEDQVKVVHHLTMTTGLDDRTVNVDCTESDCLTYLTDPGERWAYHNGPYTLTHELIAGAAGMSFDDYFNQALRDKIGMDGNWIYLGSNHVYFSTARSMARFGLLILNKGKWNDDEILSDQTYFNDMVNSSQSLNEAYGYLWWLNGKDSYQLPRLQLEIPGMFTPDAPEDMIVAAGKNGQLINIVPSKNIVIVRMGDNPDDSLVPTEFQKELWTYLNDVGL